MTLHWKTLGVVVVLVNLGLAEARAQGTSPGDRALRRQQFTAFLLGRREIARQERDLRAELRVVRRQDLLIARRAALALRNPLAPIINRLTQQINRLQTRFLQLLDRLIQGVTRVNAALDRIRQLEPGSARLARLEQRAILQEQLIETFRRRPPPVLLPSTPANPNP